MLTNGEFVHCSIRSVHYHPSGSVPSADSGDDGGDRRRYCYYWPAAAEIAAAEVAVAAAVAAVTDGDDVVVAVAAIAAAAAAAAAATGCCRWCHCRDKTRKTTPIRPRHDTAGTCGSGCCTAADAVVCSP